MVVIRLDAQLADGQSQRVLASRRFEIRQPSQGREVDQVVNAFGQATDELGRQLLEWLAQP